MTEAEFGVHACSPGTRHSGGKAERLKIRTDLGHMAGWLKKERLKRGSEAGREGGAVE